MIVLLTVVPGVLPLSADTLPPLSERQPITVGVTADSFPYGFITPDGRWSGYSSELMDAVARTMHLEIKREAASSSDSHRRFKAGEFDILQAYSQTKERQAFADFSVPYLTLQGAVFISKTGSRVKTLTDIAQLRFAVIGAGSVGESFLRDHHLQPQLVPVSSSEEALRAIENGRADAVFMSQLTAASVIEARRLHHVAMFGSPYPGYDIRHCFAVHKGDAELLARLNEGLAILNRTGEYQEIYDRWFGRIASPLFTREQVRTYVACALALGLLASVWGLLRQRALRKRIAGQAAELAGKEALLQALYDNIPMAISVIEAAPDGHRIVAINRQAEPFFGLAPAQAAGQLLHTVNLEPEWAKELRDVLQKWPTDGHHVRVERQLPTRHRLLTFTLVALPSGPAGQARVCVLVEDISERRQLDEEVAQGRKLRAVGELVGGIAHEFNNLLTPVMLKVDEIQLDRSDDVRLRGELSVINQAARRAAELTRRLLTFGRKTESQPEIVALSFAVSNVFDLLRQTVDRRIAWVNGVPPDLPPLFLNVTDLSQILLNLLINARDTLIEKLEQQPDGWEPCIQVEAVVLTPNSGTRLAFGGRAPALGWQRLTVRDNGMGIPAVVRERIFEPFFTTKEVGKGTGLGLATVWHLVTAFGGTIEVESKMNSGTAFHVLLPIIAAPQPTLKAVVAAAPLPARATRILVVEDDEQVASLVCALVKRAGHEVERFSDGAVAWRHLETRWADYGPLIFDVNMPGLTGIELARRVRAAGCSSPLMIMSGRLSSSELDALTDAHVDRVLPKPFAMEDLLSAIRDCLTATPTARQRPVVS
ncbi:MAG: transporter substrate-binding domain-containing protein [Opitutus sp.]